MILRIYRLKSIFAAQLIRADFARRTKLLPLQSNYSVIKHGGTFAGSVPQASLPIRCRRDQGPQRVRASRAFPLSAQIPTSSTSICPRQTRVEAQACSHAPSGGRVATDQLGQLPRVAARLYYGVQADRIRLDEHAIFVAEGHCPCGFRCHCESNDLAATPLEVHDQSAANPQPRNVPGRP